MAHLSCLGVGEKLERLRSPGCKRKPFKWFGGLKYGPYYGDMTSIYPCSIFAYFIPVPYIPVHIAVPYKYVIFVHHNITIILQRW